MRVVLYTVLLLGMCAYVTCRAFQAFFGGRDSRLPAAAKCTLAVLPAAAFLSLLVITRNMAAAVIALAHITGLLVLCDFIMLLVKAEEKARTKWRTVLFCLSLALCLGYITYGAVNAYAVTPTRYTVETSKDIGGQELRIAQLSDCHLGTTFGGEGFARHVESVNACEPDIVVITGDFIDSRTTQEDIHAACAALGKLNAPLGVYYVPGNHEYRLPQERLRELYALLENHNVYILEDESARPQDGLVICGRRDAIDRSRMSISELMSSVGENDFLLFLDHKPGEYDLYAQAQADLVLSGHTHAGQMFPLGWFIPAIGMGENTYGQEIRGSSTFIVSSGVSGLFPLRTEAKSEFVIIDILPQES